MLHQPTFKLRVDKSAFVKASIFPTSVAKATASQESYDRSWSVFAELPDKRRLSIRVDGGGDLIEPIEAVY
jgi:hypothetical protein